ncbi:MAG TPA: hypothetical protein VMY37_17635 [Thermoguttaceae bacterium]|nr:hypothetical protein [Thermoguttaceae bacterium]
MSQVECASAEKLLEGLPDAATIRRKLEANLRESRLLRRLLKIAQERERLQEETAPRG